MHNVQQGASVSITDVRGVIVATGTVTEVLKTVFRVKSKRLSGTFAINSGIYRDGNKTFTARIVTAETAVQHEGQIKHREEKELNAKFEADLKKQQAEYDALPEAIKLARKLRWFCEMSRVETVAQAPIEAIRAIVEWAIANNKEVE